MVILRQIYRAVRLRGARFLAYVITGYACPRFVGWLVFESMFSSFCQRCVAGFAKRLPTARALGRRRTARAERFVSAREILPDVAWNAAISRYRRSKNQTLVLGEIDHDGRVKPAEWIRGHLPDTDEVDDEAFNPRRRYRLEIVLDFARAEGVILIRKNFLGDRRAFRREWRSLTALAGTPGCPDVYRADGERLHLYKTFLSGPTVRQRLVQAGARILSVETDADATLAELDATARIEAVWARGRDVFRVLPARFCADLEKRIDAVHRKGVTGFSLTFGNVVLHPGDGPMLIDFDRARRHRHCRGIRYSVFRDRDRQLFNRIYDCEALTERSARQLVKRLATPYSPFDLGRGLATRGFWSVESGTGRWEYLNRRVLSGLLTGYERRVLDLGSYNGLMPLLMLRAGAEEVVAVEKSAEMIEHAKNLRRVFEWRYMRSYNLKLRHADMRAILEDDWGPFDIVTAFCSLYYLDELDMQRIVERCAELAPVMVVQAKTDTASDAANDKARKSSLPFLRALLESHGFPRVSIVHPTGYNRPLLVGYRESP